jgi:hypothetical protein
MAAYLKRCGASKLVDTAALRVWPDESVRDKLLRMNQSRGQIRKESEYATSPLDVGFG